MKSSLIRSSSAGFTLIEMLVVVAVISILISLAGYNNTRVLKKAKDTAVRSELNLVRTAVYQFALDNNGRLPERLEQLSPDYLKSINLSWRGAEASGRYSYDSTTGLVGLVDKNDGAQAELKDFSGQLYADY